MNDLKPDVSSGKKFSAIWIIPLVALAVGIYMVIHTMMTEGPTITVTFKTAEGLEAGKTKVRYRDVNIGLVEEVTLTEGLDAIVVTIKLELAAKSMLREDTRFWVVRARVGAGGVSGIGTILSGAYIQLDPGNGAPAKRDFVGLDEPPLTPGDAPGVRLVLFSENAGSISSGDAILYRGYKVGRIEAVTLDPEKRQVRYDAFIDAPYDSLVTTSTRFWNISGVDISASAAGLEVRTGSLQTILLGGVSFDTPPGLPPGQQARSGATYKLNASYSDLNENPYKFSIAYVVEFKQSLRGLEPGAPVEYRGIQIGHVDRILLKEFAVERVDEDAGADSRGNSIPVLIYLEPGRMGMDDSAESVAQLRDIIIAGIGNGMRASLQTGNLLTGKQFIDVDYHPGAVQVAATDFDGNPVIPSVPSGLGRLEYKVSSLLDKINALPLETTVANANTVLGNMDGAIASLTATLDSAQGILDEDSTKRLTGELNQTLAELRKIVAGLGPDAAAGQSLRNSIYELNNMLRNLEKLTSTLSDKPNAIIFPSNIPADPVPEARAQ